MSRTTPSRTNRVIHDLKELFVECETLGEDHRVAVLPTELSALTAGLRGTPPRSSQSAEAALTILAISLTEERIFDISERLESDRSISDRLSREILSPRGIPATRGALQSSSYRAGYASPHADDGALRAFVKWYDASGRTLADLRVATAALVSQFLAAASIIAPLPTLADANFTFSKYVLARDRLLHAGSGGAFEQYLLAGLINGELSQLGTGLRAETKNVGANDRASKVPGDIQIKSGQTTVAAYEVSAASWSSKLDQSDVAARSGLTRITIAAPGVSRATPNEVAHSLGGIWARDAVDVAIVDLHTLMDATAARITPHGRADAFRFLYECLIRWHSRQPDLAQRVVGVLTDLGLVLEPALAETSPPQSPVESALEDQVFAAIATTTQITPDLLRNLAAKLEQKGLTQ